MSKCPRCQPLVKQAAFTLLELILVVLILAITAAYVQTKIQKDDSYQLDGAVEQLISAGRLCQQLAMNDSQRAFSLQISSNQIDILADGISMSSQLEGLPVLLSSEIQLSPTGAVSFNGLGESTATTINVLMSQSKNVCFESSGLIHSC